MGIGTNAFKREIGKNTGKWISNKVFGDGHSFGVSIEKKLDTKNMKLKLAILLLSVIQVTNLFSEEFSQGRYYTTNGEKFEGLILYQKSKLSAISYKPCVLEFKKDNASKPIKLENSDVSSFVIYKDSFAIVQNFKMIYHFGMGVFWGTCHRDFAKVVELGTINLYELPCEVFLGFYFGYQDYNYFVLTKDNQNFRTFDLRKNKEKEELANLFSDNNELKELILKTQYKEINLTELVLLYNLKSNK